ncbi:MAG: BrnT family toxin [Acidiferrobacterales bacterium]
MRFQFDPRKAASNLKKHEVSFADAEGVFYDTFAIHQMDPDSADEERFIAVGMGSAGIVLVVIYTLRGEEIRLISARRATRNEVKKYES